MDAVEYIKAQCRLCKSKNHCYECPLQKDGHCIVDISIVGTSEYAEKAVQIVEQWAKEHPIKTRQSEFLRMFPNAQIHDDVIWMCPKCIGCDYKPEENCNEIYCCDCKRKFWLTEVTDNGNVY